MNNDEPHTIINGVLLTNAQSMTLRVALTSFLFDLAEPGHMQDLGAIGPLYQQSALEIQKLMHNNG